MTTQNFKKPAKWIENLMLIVLPAAIFIFLVLSIYFRVFVHHPENYSYGAQATHQKTEPVK